MAEFNFKKFGQNTFGSRGERQTWMESHKKAKYKFAENGDLLSNIWMKSIQLIMCGSHIDEICQKMIELSAADMKLV